MTIRCFARCFLTLILLGVFLPPQAFAQSVSAPTDYYGDFAYQKLARTLLEYQPRISRFDFTALRSEYTRTQQYDPIGEETLEAMRALAPKIQYAKDDEEAAPYLEDYNILLRDHIAHIAVVAQAIILSRENSRFGDLKKLQAIRDGLLESLLKNGDGLKPETAYEIVTLAEETAVLRSGGYTLNGTQTYKTGVIYYNVHDVRTPDNLQGVVFTNVTLPMRHLSALDAAQGSALDLRKR